MRPVEYCHERTTILYHLNLSKSIPEPGYSSRMKHQEVVPSHKKLRQVQNSAGQIDSESPAIDESVRPTALATAAIRGVRSAN
jgi:hypothetical protein